jgi:peptide/nickel transport system substrate-binding protein
MKMKKSVVIVSLLVVVAMVLAACQTTTPTAAPAASTTEAPAAAATTAAPAATETVFARNETLYTMGKQWGPPTTWNPLQSGSYATGTIGLCYETLFLYDPSADKYIPWIAESGDWTDATTYTLKIRSGVTFSDGQPLTADDVKFTFEMGKNFPSVYYSTLWNWLTDITKVDDQTLTFTFSKPEYQEWANYLYGVAIVPEHIWKDFDENTAVTGANQPPVGSGPYLYESADQSKMVWVRNENWWGIKVMGLTMAPKRVVDIVNISNAAALGMVMQGQVDLDNNYLPGVSTLVNAGGYNLQTYYDKAPYMLSGNTAWLVMNLKKAPFSDVKFRRAVAEAIDVNDIVTNDYGNMVTAANPTGLLPLWDKFVDQDAVKQYGTTFSPDQAKADLAAAGYKDVDGDGYLENPDGSKIDLKIQCPNGWSDWMVAIQIIAKNLEAVGIKVTPDYPDYGAMTAGLYGGDFDMLINNDAQVSNTVWSYYHFIFYHPIKDQMIGGTGNYGRYDNQAVFDLVDQLDATPITDEAGMKSIISQIQAIQLQDVPMIPLWYNGVWAQMNTANWTNWPSSADGAPKYYPATWNGYWNMGAVLMLTELKPVAAQ